MKRATLVELIAFLFIILFLYTGISKLIDYNIAKEQIALTPLLAPIAGTVVIFIPVLEILTALLLFIPRTRLYGLAASLALMIAFTGYVTYLLSYNQQLPCTCGGVLEELTWPQHLIFNGAMLVIDIVALMLLRPDPKTHDRNSSLQPQL